MKELVLGKAGRIEKTTSENFHSIIEQLVKLVESPRSSIAKISMITLHDFFELLPKILVEPDLDSIFKVLMKKSVDSNIFMAEEAEKTLMSMCRNMQENKLMAFFMS